MATFYVTVAGAGDKSGSNEANAMGAAEFFTDFAIASALDRYLLESGTYTLTGNLTGSVAGTQGSDIEVWGYSNLGTLTEATGNDRPLFACGANAFRYGDNCHLRNLRFTISQADGVYGFGGGNKTVNCDSIQSGNFDGFKSNGNYDIYEGCSATAGATGQAFYLTGGSAQKFLNCYAHDTRDGFYATGRSNCVFINCITDNCTRYSIYMGTGNAYTIVNCTIYDSGDTGIEISTGDMPLVWNTSISNSTTYGAFASTACGGLWDWNNYFSAVGTDRSGVPTGSNDIDVDPEFTTPGSDFSWPLGGNLQDAGKGMTLGVG